MTLAVHIPERIVDAYHSTEAANGLTGNRWNKIKYVQRGRAVVQENPDFLDTWKESYQSREASNL